MAKPIRYCTVEGCATRRHGNGLCSLHHRRWKKYGNPMTRVRPEWRTNCSVEGCPNQHRGKGFCEKHLARFNNHGDAAKTLIRARGTGSVRPDGYVTISGKMVHRIVMEQHLARELFDYENVHHLNGQRGDNRIENLELWTRSQPHGQRVADKVVWAAELLSLYAPHLLVHEEE